MTSRKLASSNSDWLKNSSIENQTPVNARVCIYMRNVYSFLISNFYKIERENTHSSLRFILFIWRPVTIRLH